MLQVGGRAASLLHHVGGAVWMRGPLNNCGWLKQQTRQELGPLTWKFLSSLPKHPQCCSRQTLGTAVPSCTARWLFHILLSLPRKIHALNSFSPFGLEERDSDDIHILHCAPQLVGSHSLPAAGVCLLWARHFTKSLGDMLLPSGPLSCLRDSQKQVP